MRIAAAPLLAAAAVFGCQEAAAPVPNPPRLPRLLAARLEPRVVTPQGTATLRLTLDHAPGGIATLTLNQFSDVYQDGQPVQQIILHDDGQAGDDVAGDNVYVAEGLSTPPATGPVTSTTIESAQLRIDRIDQVREGLVRPRVSLGSIDTGRIGTPVITDRPDLGMQYTSRVVVIESDVAPADFASGRDSIIRRYYELFPDDRDWLIVTRAAGPDEVFTGQALRIRSGVTGIGLAPFTSTVTYGSPRRLEFVAELTRDFYWNTGDLDGAFCLATHELTHRWAAELGAPLERNSHWGSEFLRTRSGFGWEGACRFNPLELYLAGRIPADSVRDPLTAAGMTIQDVVARHGPRAPSVDRDTYTVAFVLVADRPLTDIEMAYHHYVAEQYTRDTSALGLTFEGATGGRIRLDGELPAVSVPR